MKIEHFLNLEAQYFDFHAYLIISPSEEKSKLIVEHISHLLDPKKEDLYILRPDGESGKRGEIKVDFVEPFLHHLSLRPQGKYRLGIVERADRLNLQSSNMLLKTLEEPQKDVKIFLISQTDSLLATIKSRCRTLKIDFDDISFDFDFSYDKIISSSLKKCFLTIETIVKDGNEELFLDRLISDIRSCMVKDKKPETAKLVEEVLAAKRVLTTNVNRRLLLENIILSIKET